MSFVSDFARDSYFKILTMAKQEYIAQDPMEEYNKYRDLRNNCMEEYNKTGDTHTLLRAKFYNEIMNEIWEQRILK